jgi:hypothetical protein
MISERMALKRVQTEFIQKEKELLEVEEKLSIPRTPRINLQMSGS